MSTRPPRPHAARTPAGRIILRLVAAGWLLGVVGLPVAAVVVAALAQGPVDALRALTGPVARAALWLTLWTAALVAVINALLGTLTAWLLVRHPCPGRQVLTALIDVPFAIPTVVVGLMLVGLYGPQNAAGAWLAERGLHVLFSPAGIVVALLIVTFPFVVRAVEPVLRSLDVDQEEAAYTLGAWPFTAFRRVTLPALLPAVATSALLTFARALGEFGAIVVVAGNLPRRTLTAPVYVFGAIEADRLHEASAMSLLLVVLSFSLVLAVDRFTRARIEEVAPR